MLRWLVLLVLVAQVSPAAAHKLKLFAISDGTDIEGYAYFVPGGRAKSIAVEVLGGNGQSLARATTDDEGRFRFPALGRGAASVSVDGGDGHVATFALAGDPGAAAAMTDDRAQLVSSRVDPAVLEAAVARQIAPLRQELDAFQAEIRWHDVLGGLGYILGLGGLAYGVAARRRGGDLTGRRGTKNEP